MKTLFFIGFPGDKIKKSIGNAFSRLISVTFFGLSHTLGHSEHVEGAGFIKLAVILYGRIKSAKVLSMQS
jgi:hypothetical protein